jgi:rare lipoprotein A
MASVQLRIRLALFVALCQLLSPLHTLPLQAQEKAEQNSQETLQTSKEKIEPSAEAAAGEEGFASYYAKRYNGRKTLSGARYKPDGLTAASPDLPLGCMVRVVNPANGKEVLVTVNDRCRRKKVHFIDLSRAAAKKLGILGKGTARVRIIPLDEDES